jgi:hypothetical protein
MTTVNGIAIVFLSMALVLIANLVGDLRARVSKLEEKIK